METKQSQIEKFITEQTQIRNIPEMYISVIKNNYSDDSRDIDTIQKEISLLFSKLSMTETEKRKQEIQKSVNSDSQILNTTNQQEVTQTSTIFENSNNFQKKDYRNMSTFDNHGSVNHVMIQNVSWLGNDSQKVSSENELNSMFDLNEQSNDSQTTSLISQSNKGKAYVKSNGKSILYDDNGFSSFMNISFVIMTITIFGIFLATIIILINKA